MLAIMKGARYLMELRLDNLTKKFDDTTAVDHLNLTIQDGKLTGLLGPSGCGKSTLLYMISGLEKPTEGRIFFGDKDVTDVEAEDRGIGLVFQNYALYPHMTVEQNICFPLENMGVPRKERVQRAAEMAKLLQIGDLLKRKPGQLSGGQQQRVAIARALVKRPDVLLLDEPLSNLDAKLRLEMRSEIRRIQQETGVTTIFVTHDQEEAMSISDMIVVMKDGVIQQIGRPQEVYDEPVNLFVAKFLGTPPINVFSGSIKGGKLYIGAEAVLDAEGVSDRAVVVGVRPEGFVMQDDGRLSCALSGVEVMGRDISVVSTNEASQNASVRAIIASENKVDTSAKTVRFELKPAKTFVFDAQTGERIGCALS